MLVGMDYLSLAVVLVAPPLIVVLFSCLLWYVGRMDLECRRALDRGDYRTVDYIRRHSKVPRTDEGRREARRYWWAVFAVACVAEVGMVAVLVALSVYGGL